MPYNQKRRPAFAKGRSVYKHNGQSVSSGRGGNRRKGGGEYIPSHRFIKAAKSMEIEEYTAKHTFEDFAVEELIKTNIRNKGFTVPSPIQDQAIPVGLEMRDVVGIANTGTGKTVAFGVPVLHKLMTMQNAKALIMAPTRELAQQINDEFAFLAKGSGVAYAVLIGGMPMGPQFKQLSANPKMVIGTPGRIKDHMERKSLDLSDFNIIVLDEVDRMLDMGFVQDMRFILATMPAKRQSYFFSATIDKQVSELMQTFCHDPVIVSVKSGETSENVEQDIVTFYSPDEKFTKLESLLTDLNPSKILVFDETQRGVERLSKKLQGSGFAVDAIHGGKTQAQRTRALNRFKSDELSVLIATDVAARGIDIKDITHVINYNTPRTYDDYVHRIGRAGRAGKTGTALTFVQER